MIPRKRPSRHWLGLFALLLSGLAVPPVVADTCDTPDCEEQLSQLERYADRGDLDAMAVVAVALATGEGLPQDKDRARQLITEATRMRSAQAAHIKSGWRREGVIFDADEDRANRLLDRAVAGQYAPAYYERGLRTLTQGADYLNEGLADIAEAAEEGYQPAMYALARLLEDSAEESVDLIAAGEYYSQLAIQGYRDSRSRLREIIATLQLQEGDEEAHGVTQRFGEVLDMEVITVFGISQDLDQRLAHMNEQLRSRNMSRLRTGSRLQRTRPCAMEPECQTIFEQGADGEFADTVSSILGM